MYKTIVTSVKQYNEGGIVQRKGEASSRFPPSRASFSSPSFLSEKEPFDKHSRATSTDLLFLVLLGLLSLALRVGIVAVAVRLLLLLSEAAD